MSYFNLLNAYDVQTTINLPVKRINYNSGEHPWFYDGIDRSRGTFKETPCSHCNKTANNTKCTRKNGIFSYECDLRCCYSKSETRNIHMSN